MAQVKRVQRTSINGQRSRLSVKGKEPGYYYRIVNDVDGRVQDFLDRGYEIVTDNELSVGDKRITNPTQEGTPKQVSVGNGVKGYVMRLKEEWHNEDVAAKKARVDEIESNLVRDSKREFNGKIDINK